MPPEGGTTEFASLTAAYAALPEHKKTDIEELIAEHSIAHSRVQIAPNLMNEAFQKDTPPVDQRLVRTIPETGKKALFGRLIHHPRSWLANREGQSPVEGAARLVNTAAVCVPPRMAGE